MKMIEKLRLGQNNEGLFNPIPNNSLRMNQIRRQMDLMKQWEEDEKGTFNLKQATNQLSENQNDNQYGNNINIFDNSGNIMKTQNEGI